jgi:hypothetical protein
MTTSRRGAAAYARRHHLTCLLVAMAVIGHVQIYAAMTATIALSECSVITPDKEDYTGSFPMRSRVVRRPDASHSPAAYDSKANRGSRAIWGGNVSAPAKPTASIATRAQTAMAY